MRMLRRWRATRALRGARRLHLGCGANLLAGWANIDVTDTAGAIALDLTEPLPLADGGIELVYSEHFLEHLTREQARALLAECHRVLQRGGVLRVSTPDLRMLVREYEAQRTTEWTDVGWTPATPCQLLNEGVRSWGHQFVYDEDELRRLLAETGYRRATRAAWRESATAALRGLESRPFHGDLIVDAEK